MTINLREDKDRIPELIAQSFSLGDISNWTEQDALEHIKSLEKMSTITNDIITVLRQGKKNG